MTKTTMELSPCPVCGGVVVVEEMMVGSAKCVTCPRCGVMGPVEGTKEEAIAAWNGYLVGTLRGVRHLYQYVEKTQKGCRCPVCGGYIAGDGITIRKLKRHELNEDIPEPEPQSGWKGWYDCAECEHVGRGGACRRDPPPWEVDGEEWRPCRFLEKEDVA